jgi:hypothetical protein
VSPGITMDPFYYKKEDPAKYEKAGRLINEGL